MGEITAPELYEHDFYSWTQQQSQALRRAADERVNAPADVDWANLEGIRGWGSLEVGEPD